MSDCYCATLRAATRKISANYDDALAPAGINVGQYSLLRCVQRRSPVSLTDIGHDLKLDRTTISRNVKVLQKDGLIKMVRGEADRREALVALSEKGEACLTIAVPLWNECQQAMESRLGPIKVTALQEILRSL